MSESNVPTKPSILLPKDPIILRDSDENPQTEYYDEEQQQDFELLHAPRSWGSEDWKNYEKASPISFRSRTKVVKVWEPSNDKEAVAGAMKAL